MEALLESVLVLLSSGVLLVIISKTLWPNFIKSVEERRKKINEDIEKAEEERLRLEELSVLKDSELEKLRVSKSEILVKTLKEAKVEQESIINDAKERANVIIDKAQLEIEKEQEKMENELQKATLEYVNLISKKFISAKISDDEELKMFSDAIEKVE